MLCNGFTISQDNLAPSQQNNVRRYEIHSNSTLILKYLYESDTGVYSCQAQSSAGFDLKSTSVTVNNKPVRISAEYVAGNFITISLNGTQNQWFMTGYQIHYKPLGRNSDKFQIIPLDRRIRQFRYTFTNLSPLTTYMFCIVYVFETELYTVHCTNIIKKTTAPRELYGSMPK